MVSLRNYKFNRCAGAILLLCATVSFFSGCAPSIHDAIARGDLACVEAMLESSPDLVRALDGKKKTALHAAVTYRKIDALPLLLEHGADISATDATGMTPLHVAGMLGRREEAKWLLAHGANPLLEDVYGDTPLHTAVIFGHGQIIKLLAENGISPDRPNGNNETPLAIAKKYRQEKVERYLIYLMEHIN